MRVDFPADVREDIHVMGLQLWDLIVYFLPSCVLGIVFFLLPFPMGLRFLFLFAIPTGTFLWLFLEIPSILRRRRGYKKEPEIRTSAENTRNIQEIVTVREVDGPFVITDDGHVQIFLSATPGPWITKPESEQELAGLVWVQINVRAISQGCYIDTWVINDVEVLRSEMERQEKEQAQLPEKLKEIGRKRREYWTHLENTGFSRSPLHYIRISTDPFELRFDTKPKSKGERFEKAKQILTEVTRDVCQKLQSTGVQTVIISGEILRDVAARQLMPQVYREGSTTYGDDWVKSGHGGGMPVPERVPVREKQPLRFLPFIYRTTRPLRNLWPGSYDSIYIVPVLLNEKEDTPGLELIINELYAGFEMVYTAPMVYHPGDSVLDEDVERALTSRYVFFVVPNSDKWQKDDLSELAKLINSTAKLYGCKVDISLKRGHTLLPLTA
ncbi:MAG: hypothetical protein ACOY46_02955 [Bacillota bacterium]